MMFLRVVRFRRSTILCPSVTMATVFVVLRSVRRLVVLLALILALFLMVMVLQVKWTLSQAQCADSPGLAAHTAHDGMLRHRRNMPTDDQQLFWSDHKDIEVRGKYQKKNMQDFCKSHGYPGGRFSPKNRDTLYQFKRHLLFDDEKKIIFCFVPKVGSTNMKRLMLYTSGHLSLDTLDWPWVDHWNYLEPALRKASFLNNNLTDKGIMHRLQTYYKFMIVRNPLERMVSAFRDKLESPIKAAQWHNQFPEKIKKRILQQYHPDEFDYWLKSSGFNVFNLSVTFTDYIQYLTDSHWSELNEHFQPQIEVCHPCFVDYDFYGDFRKISDDAQAIIRKLNANSKYYRDESLHKPTKQTWQYAEHYYKQLNEREQLRLFGSWYDELEFYSTLYPSQ